MFDASPDGWTTRNLGEAVEAILTGPFGCTLHEYDYISGGIPVVNPTNIENGRIIPDPEKTISVDKRSELSSFILKEGDVVLGRRGDIGRCSAVSKDQNGWLCGTGCFIIRPGAKTDTHFLTSLLGSLDCRKKLESLASGATMLNLGNKSLQGLDLLLPPLDEQRRIAEVLRSVDDAIRANLAALSQIERARAAILVSAFDEAAWEPVQLGQLGRWQSGGTPSKSDNTKWGGGIPWICPRDMKSPIVNRSLDTISKSAISGSCKLVLKGTLLLVVRGMILARAIPTAITGVDATYNQDIKAFKPNGRASPRFVQLCLQHQEADLLRVVNTATHGTKKLDTSTIEAMEIALPDRDTQDALVESVSRLDEANVLYGMEHVRLKETRVGLLSDLLSGRVRVAA